MVMDKILERLPRVAEVASENVTIPFFQILDESITAISSEDKP
jgi:hypothetical protein